MVGVLAPPDEKGAPKKSELNGSILERELLSVFNGKRRKGAFLLFRQEGFLLSRRRGYRMISPFLFF